MKYFLLILIFIPFFSSGQSKLDSLWGIWQDKTKEDAVRLDAIDALIWKGYLFSNPDSAFQLAQIQYDYAYEKGFPLKMAKALNIQGISHAIKINYDEALKYYEKSLVIFQVEDNTAGIAGALNNIAGIYMSQGNLALAIEYNSKALKLYDEIGNLRGSAKCLSNIGRIYNNQNEIENAIKFYESSLQKFESLGDKKAIGGVHHNLGNIYTKKNEVEKALSYYRISIGLHRELDNKLGIAYDLAAIGTVYQNKGNPSKALDYYFQAFETAKQLEAKDLIGKYKNQIGGAYYLLEKLDSSLYFSSSALSLAQAIENPQLISDASAVLYQSYKQMGKTREALSMLELHTSIEDSLQSEENQRAVIRFEYQNKFEKNLERQKGEEQLKRAKERFFFITAFFLLILGIAIFLRIRYSRNLAEKTSLLHEIELLKEKGSLKFLINEDKKEALRLDKEKIEAAIQSNLNPTDWKILNAIFNNPVITQKAIAEEVSLSVEGVKSALRRMYRKFDLEKSNNQKLALLMKATKISSSGYNPL